MSPAMRSPISRADWQGIFENNTSGPSGGSRAQGGLAALPVHTFHSHTSANVVCKQHVLSSRRTVKNCFCLRTPICNHLPESLLN